MTKVSPGSLCQPRDLGCRAGLTLEMALLERRVRIRVLEVHRSRWIQTRALGCSRPSVEFWKPFPAAGGVQEAEVGSRLLLLSPSEEQELYF